MDSGVDAITDRLGASNLQDDSPRTDDEYAQSQLTLRAIVTSKEAGVIIGKAGQNVADLRDKTGVRAGVSKVVPGVHDRVLTVTGILNGIADAYGLVADCLVKGAPQMGIGGSVAAAPNTHRKINPPPHLSLHDPQLTKPSYSSPHLTQPDGYDHWPTGTEDQADSRCKRCTHGCTKRDASTINRTHCRGARHARRHSKGCVGNWQVLGGR